MTAPSSSARPMDVPGAHRAVDRRVRVVRVGWSTGGEPPPPRGASPRAPRRPPPSPPIHVRASLPPPPSASSPPPPPPPPRRARAARAPRRGGRLRRPVDRRGPTGPTASRRWPWPRAWTRAMRLGTGVVNPFTRGPAVLAQHAAALADASGGRFVPRARLVVGRDRRALERAAVREAAHAGAGERVEVLREVLAGGRGPGGFKLETPPAAGPDRHRRAARPHAAARRRARRRDVRELPAAVGRRDTSRARSPARARPAGGHGGHLPLLLHPEPARGLDVARFMFAAYGTVPVYEAFFRGSAGARRSTRWWRRGARATAAARLERVPEELIREIFILGDPEARRSAWAPSRSAASRRWC